MRGWSARPLRVKKWNHWCVRDDRAVLMTTIADVGYLGLVFVLLRDLAAKRDVRRGVVLPAAIGLRLGDEVRDAVRFASPLVSVETIDRDDATSLRVRAWGGFSADVIVDRPPGYASLDVVVPFDHRRSQFTSKHVARRVRGEVRVGREHWTFGERAPAFGCLDFGRGIWPYRTRWQWAAAAGIEDGRTLGLNLGGTWTDGTGATENALWIDGRVHAIEERVVFDVPRRGADRASIWTIRSDPPGRVDLRFEPSSALDAHVPLVVLSSRLTMRFGRFSGTILDGDGRPVRLRALDGWAEDHVARW